MPKAPLLIVREHAPWKRYAVIGAVVMAFIVTAYLFYHYGQSSAGQNLDALYEERGELRDAIASLKSELGDARDQVAVLKRSSEINKQAYKEVDNSLTSLQSEILELKEEVAFYRSIVAPRESAKGLHIQRFKIEPNREANSFKYKLILTQVIKQNRVTKGRVEMSIEGLQNGEQRVLSLAEVDTSKQDKLVFRFKYFQNFEGDMVLPGDFVPSRVQLKVISNIVTIDKTFDWPFDGSDSVSLQSPG